jgi:hypothetical protein
MNLLIPGSGCEIVPRTCVGNQFEKSTFQKSTKPLGGVSGASWLLLEFKAAPPKYLCSLLFRILFRRSLERKS